MHEIAQLASARRARINSASSPLPNLLLFVIPVTSLALVAVASVPDTQHRRWHLVLITALTVLVALNLALVVALDQPFDGAAKVSDAPLREGLPPTILRCDRRPVTSNVRDDTPLTPAMTTLLVLGSPQPLTVVGRYPADIQCPL